MNAPQTDRLLTYDYSRSFIQWDTSRDNIPRCAVHASCRLRDKGGEEREFFMSHPCAGEQLYEAQDITHNPVEDFYMACEPGREFMCAKVYSGDPVEFRMVHRVGEVVPTTDGIGSRIAWVKADMRHFSKVRPLLSDADIAKTMLANNPIIGRTQFRGDDGETTVITEYPVTVMNTRPSDKRWQVDTGPVLVPDFSEKTHLKIGLLRQAYLVYNSWDWAEITLRQLTKPIGKDHVVMHYGEPKRIAVRNQLFAAELA